MERINRTSLCDLRSYIICVKWNKWNRPTCIATVIASCRHASSTTIRHNRFGCFPFFVVVAVIVICIICTIRIGILTHISKCARGCVLARDQVSISVRRTRTKRRILYYRRRLNRPSQMRNAGRTVHTLLSSGLTINQAQDENWYDNANDEKSCRRKRKRIEKFLHSVFDKNRIASPSLLQTVFVRVQIVKSCAKKINKTETYQKEKLKAIRCRSSLSLFDFCLFPIKVRLFRLHIGESTKSITINSIIDISIRLTLSVECAVSLCVCVCGARGHYLLLG